MRSTNTSKSIAGNLIVAKNAIYRRFTDIVQGCEVQRHKTSLFIKLTNSLLVFRVDLFTREVVEYRRSGWGIHCGCVFRRFCALA
jgi:hypothetical protein